MNWEQQAQRAAEARIEALAEHEELCEGLPAEEWPEAPESNGPWCGCQTCVVREVLDAAWPIMRRAALDEARGTIRC